MDQDGCRLLEVDGGAVLRREVGQESQTRLALVETLGGIAPPTKQFLHVFAEEAVGGGAQQYRTAVAAALKLVYVLKLVYARVAL